MCILTFPSKIWAKYTHYTRQKTANGEAGQYPEKSGVKPNSTSFIIREARSKATTHCLTAIQPGVQLTT